MQNLITTADRMKKLSAQLSAIIATVAAQDFNQKNLTIAHVADSTSCSSTTEEAKVSASDVVYARVEVQCAILRSA